MSFSEITRKIANSLISVFFNEKKHKKAIFQPRRLHIDPLEERQLLSVNVVMPQEKMMTSFSEHSSPTMSANRFYINSNNPYGGAQYTETEWSTDYMASNNQGDTVIVWTQNDYVYKMDRYGNYIYVLDQFGSKTEERERLVDRFGNFYDDYNIYAQYLTNQVERLTIPEDLLTNSIVGAYGSFKLVYAPYTVQKLSFKSVTSADGYLFSGTGPNIIMEFCLGGEDTTGNGVPDYTHPITFNENLSPQANAREIQYALGNLGGIYAGVTVTAESTTDFLITFGEAARSKYGTNAVPELEVRDTRAIQGIYPGILISTESAPIVLSTTDSWGNDQGILVDPSNPQLTAERIQQAFNDLGAYSPFPRVENYTRNNNPGVDSDLRPSYQIFYSPEVSVTYVNATTFDITFINGAGLSFHDVMLVSATDEWGTELINNATGGLPESFTQTIKRSSDVFRVNAPEENNPLSSVPLVTQQLNPSVAMDADGDFVITWQSEVGSVGNRTVTDIYARKFSPQAIVDDAKIFFYDDGYTTERVVGIVEGEQIKNNPVQGVRPVGDQFKVNSFSNSYLSSPSIGMDPDGNFIIAWSATYQSLTDGNGLYFKRYDRYGTPLSDDVMLTNPVTDPSNLFPICHTNVAISNDGYAVVTWVYSEDGNFMNYSEHHGMYMSVFAPGSNTPMPGFERYAISGSAFNAKLSFDANNNFLITYSDTFPTIGNKGAYGMESVDVRAQLFSFDRETRTFDQARGEFLVHSLSNWLRDTYAEESWRGQQYNGIGRLDADGDMVFIYQGYGPDANLSGGTSGYTSIPGSFFAKYLNQYKNGDLLNFFNPAREDFIAFTSDVDLAIRDYLVRAIRDGATNDQIARLNAIFESVAGMMRGGANDIFTTTILKGNWNYSPGTNIAAQSSDANVTSTRDGVNARYYLMIPNYIGENPTAGGTINLRIWRELYDTDQTYALSGGATVSFTLPTTTAGNVTYFNPTQFRANLYNELNSVNPNNGQFQSNNWSALLTPVFNVGLITPCAEVNYYAPGAYEFLYGDTMWELPYYYYGTGGDLNGYHIYEIVFVGGAHDTMIDMEFTGSNNALNRHGISNSNFFGNVSMVTQHWGYQGTLQTTPGLSVLPNGSYVASWFTNVTTTNGTVVDRKINYRYFLESTDSVGPKVTDVILPNGQYVANQAMVTYKLEHIVVTVDKELLANGTDGDHSVLNPKNWAVIKDGVQLTNAIKSISFGMNKAKDFIDENPNSIVADSFLSYGSNKWEVVIEFNEPLDSGNYELVAKNTLCDTTGVTYRAGKPTYGVGNALGRDGTPANSNGANFSRIFTIVEMDGTLSFYGGSSGTEEKLVSTAGGNHYTRLDDPIDTPKNPTSVASDQNGNFVTVWTDETIDPVTGQKTGGGILAMIYRQDFVETANGGRESVITPIREFRVTGNLNASYASVAMDADGDFVVTWMQDDTDGRNIYAKAFNFNGSSRLDANGNPTTEFRVNSHTGKHNYPSIAMDLSGGFVITWESLNQVSKTSGYDIYFQRYDSSCTAIGGVDAIQAVQFNGDLAQGTSFDLLYIDEMAGISIPIQDIKTGANLQQTSQNIKAKLTVAGLEVEVGVSGDTVLIQFIGSYGARAIAPLIVTKLSSTKPGQSITVQTQTTGVLSETRANDTTVGDKRYPAVAIASTGEVVISWTSWGQGADNPYESNIYAKNFPSNDVVASMNRTVSLAERIEILSKVDRSVLKVVTSDDPNNHIIPSSEYTGVVMVWIADEAGNYAGHGTGSLLTSGLHILTAAHVTADANGLPIPIDRLRVTFNLPSGPVTYGVSQNIIHWSYTGDAQRDTDLAILVLSGIAPAEAARYDIYRDSDEIGSIFTVTGYGLTGTGVTGDIVNVPVPPAQGERRWGQNKYEATADIFSRYYGSYYDYNPNTLVYDFDSGYSQNDAFGRYFGIYDAGLGYLEASSAHGDSGGPSFINGKIAGVVSWGSSVFFPSMTDIDNNMTNCTFGEFSFDVRVSAYSDWIDTIVSSGTTEYLVNETETGNQIWSDVAISMSGEVIFTWTSFNQSGSGDGPGGSATDISGVFARRFTMNGTPVLGAVGVATVTPTNPNGYAPGYDMTDPDNIDPLTGELIDPETGEPLPAGAVVFGREFRVNDYIVGNQWYSSVSIANNGDFMITWESYQDKNTVQVKLPDTGHGVGGTITETVTDYGVYAKRFTNLETLRQSLDNPGVAQYGLPDNTRFIPGYGYVGIHGEIGTEFRVNTKSDLPGKTWDHILGDQTGATVALNANGDAIVVFQSRENTGSKVYYRAFTLSVDRSAPIVTETVLVVNELTYDANGNLIVDNNGVPVTKDGVMMPVRNDSVIYGYPTQIVVTFSEEMYNAYVYDPKSVLNPANWQLYRNGISMFAGIADIQFGLDKAFHHNGFTLNSRTGKYEAVITFSQPLIAGNYSLVIRDSVTNLAEHKLDGDYNGMAGGNFSRTFQVVAPATAEETDSDPGDDKDQSQGPVDADKNAFVNTEFGNDKPAIASADDGSYVVVAVHYGTPGTPTEPGDPNDPFDPTSWDPATDPIPRIGNIIMQRYDRNGGKIGAEQTVNTFMTGHQTDPGIAMDKDGNFAVVWAGAGSRSNNGIYMRLYDSQGRAVGDQIWVNEVSTVNCSTPKVAYFTDANGNGSILVTWMEYNSTTRSYVIMSRVYDSKGVQQNVVLDGTNRAKGTSMALVAENTRDVRSYDIAFAPGGELILTWQIHNAATNSQDIFAKVLKYTTTSSTGGTLVTKVNAFVVNQYTSLIQTRPSVAASATGFVITWASERQASDSYDIFARRFNMNGVAQPILGTTGDYLINSQKATFARRNDRDYPNVSMASNGNFVITWSSYDQEPNNWDNATGQPAHDYGTFARAFNSNGNDLKNGDYAGKDAAGKDRYVDFMPNTLTKEFRLNDTTLGDQIYSVATISAYGMSFAWVGAADSLLITEYDDLGRPVTTIPFTTVDVFTRTYTVASKSVSTSLGGSNGFSTRSSYAPAQRSGGGGYIGQGANTYKYDNQETLFLDGTNGNDVFEIIVTASGAFQVRVNGKSITVGSQVRDIQIDGLGGQDKLIITNEFAGDNTAKLNAADNLVSFSTKNGTLTVYALRVDNVDLKVGGTNNSLQVVSGANDVLAVGFNDMSLTGDNHSYIAKGFDFVSAIATASSASAILYDSAGDDVLTMTPQKAVMKGQEYEHTVSGFGNITAYSTRGNNMAYMYGSTGDDAVFASGGTVAMTGSGFKNTIFGFEKTYLIGNGGNDSATLVSSYSANRFTGTDTLMEAVFGRNSTVNFYGFRNFTIYGNGGNDVVVLSNITQGTGLNANNSSTTKTYLNSQANISYTVVGINDVRGIQSLSQATLQAISTAMDFPASTTLLTSGTSTVGETPKASSVALNATIYEDDLYQLLALEHEQNSKKTIEDEGNELDIDYLLKIGAL